MSRQSGSGWLGAVVCAVLILAAVWALLAEGGCRDRGGVLVRSAFGGFECIAKGALR